LTRFAEIDWSRAVLDACSVRAVSGPQTGPNPTDRAKLGTKQHLLSDGQGIPLAIRLTGANRNDSQEALALLNAIPSLFTVDSHRPCPQYFTDCRFYVARPFHEPLR